MTKATESKYVAITYDTPSFKRITAKDRAERKRLEETIHEAIKRFHTETRCTLEEIELYPCDCKECRASAA
jgi:hypothetical protein